MLMKLLSIVMKFIRVLAVTISSYLFLRPFSVIKKVLLIFTLTITAINVANAEKVTIEVLAEELYPLHYQENDEIIGSSVELIKKIFAKSKLEYTLKIQPWARVYNTALQKENVLLLSIARFKQREALFNWIGPVVKFDYFLYGLAEMKIPEQMKLSEIKKYKIAIIRKTALQQYLTSKDFNNYYLVNNSAQAIKMLFSKRVDLVAGIDTLFMENCHRQQLACHKLKPIYKFKQLHTDIFIAMSKSTDAAIIKQIKLAYQQVIQRHTATQVH
jgi:polar amino acid transport system substrate-binding protein